MLRTSCADSFVHLIVIEFCFLRLLDFQIPDLGLYSV